MSCIDHNRPGDKDGYSHARRAGVRAGLHRWAYCDAKSVPLSAIEGLVIRHTCDNPRCINPAHLITGTNADNQRDKAARRRCTHIKLTQAQVDEVRATCTPSPPNDNRPNALGFNALARKFGVNSGTVRAAYLGRTHPGAEGGR